MGTRRVAAGAFWSSIETWGTQLFQFLAFMALARLLGPEAWGVVGIALILTAAGDTLVNEGGWIEALVQKAVLEPEDLDSVFWLLVAGGTLTALIATALAGPMARWFAEPQLRMILPWLAWGVPLGALGVVPRALLWRRLACKSLALRSLLGMLGAGLAGVLVAVAGGGIWSLVVFQLAQPLIGAIVLWTLEPWRPGLRASRSHLRRLLSFVSGVLGERALLLIEALLPRILIGQALGPMLVGNYTLARKILELGSKLLWAPVSRVAMPTFIALVKNTAPSHNGLSTAIGLTAVTSFPAFIGLAVVMPDLVLVLFGSAWVPAVPAVRIAVLVGPTVPLAWLLSAFLMAHGDSRSVLRLAVSGTVLFAIPLLLLPRISVEGILVALLVRSWLMLPARLVCAARLSPIDVPACLRIACGPALAAAVMAAGSLVVAHALPAGIAPSLRLSACAVSGGAIYSAALSLLARPLLRRTVGLAQRA